MRIRRSSLKMNIATPSLCPLRPTPHALNARTAQSSTGTPGGAVDQDDHLVPGAALVVLELLRQRRRVGRRQEPRAVGDERGRRRRDRRRVRGPGDPNRRRAGDHEGRERRAHWLVIDAKSGDVVAKIVTN